MSFKSLEQRFNENVNTLYVGATSKFAGGKPSNNRTDVPLIVRAPGKGYWGPMESRSTPVQSAAQDVKRLTLFQIGSDGIKFLAKQQLLQTGNTFEFTRALNPAFVVGNAVPFLHIKRNLRPLNELAGKTDTSYANVKSMGQLQLGTYSKLNSKVLENFNEFATTTTFNRPGVGSTLVKRLLGPLNSLKDTVKNTVSAFNPNQKRNIGELGTDKWGPESWKISRPELKNYIPNIQKRLYTTQQSYATERVTENISRPRQTPKLPSLGGVFNTAQNAITSAINATNRQLTSNANLGTITSTNTVSFIKYFNGAESLKNATRTGTDIPSSATAKRGANGQLPDKVDKISYIKDPSNYPGANTAKNYRPAYSQINTEVTDPKNPIGWNDPVNVSFAMGKDEPIRFRAFIKDLNETSNPQYQTFQYIGRVEKFVNYTGVQREASFKLSVIAFGQDELDTVWRRINYLTGMTFPYGFTRGILQPNIIRLTIGGVYTNQPGYITSLNTNFNEPAGSWDIDKEVPIGATIDIKFTLIEKATRVADSPFYGITDGSGRENGEPMPYFSNTIEVPQPQKSANNSKKDPPKTTEPPEEPDLAVTSRMSNRGRSRGIGGFSFGLLG